MSVLSQIWGLFLLLIDKNYQEILSYKFYTQYHIMGLLNERAKDYWPRNIYILMFRTLGMCRKIDDPFEYC